MRTNLRLRAVVFEDDPQLQLAIATILGSHGFDVLVSFGAAATIVDRAEQQRPDVVVVDLALSGVGGLAVIAALRSAVPTGAVIVLSPFETLRGPVLDAGADEVLSPSDLRVLTGWAQEQAATASGCGCGHSG